MRWRVRDSCRSTSSCDESRAAIGRVSATNETAALRRLAAACDTQMAAYPTALEEDEARLAALEAAPWAPGVHAATLHALRALVSEKRALAGASEAVAAALAALVAKAAAPRGRRRPS